jgi:hypothetical protein
MIGEVSSDKLWWQLGAHQFNSRRGRGRLSRVKNHRQLAGAANIGIVLASG